MVNNERMFKQETGQCVSAAHFFPASLCVATVVTALNGRSPGRITSTLRTRGRHETAGSEDDSQHLSSAVPKQMLPVLLRIFLFFFLNKEFCLNIDVVPIYRNIITRFLSNMLFFREPFPPIDLHRFLSSACAPGNETTTSA